MEQRRLSMLLSFIRPTPRLIPDISLISVRHAMHQKVTYANKKSMCYYLEILEFTVIFVLHFLRVDTVAFRGWVVIIEIATICSMLDVWDDWSFDLSVVHCIPVDVFEERMCFDGGSTTETVDLNISQAIGRIDGA